MTEDDFDLDIDPSIDLDDPRLDRVDDLIARWHKLPVTAMPLPEYVGLTEDQLADYACRNVLPEDYVPPGTIDDPWEPLRVLAMVGAILLVTVGGLWYFQPGGKP